MERLLGRLTMPFTLVDKMKSIRQSRMRAVVLAEHLAGRTAEQVVDELALLIEQAVGRGDSGASLALASLASALGATELVPYPRRRELYAAAKRRSYPEVARLFFDLAPVPMPGSYGEDPLAPERPLTPHGRPLALGERKALARAHRREMLEHLLRDPHPDVVAVLLDNPHLTERDVLVVASRRPSLPQALAHVAANERWAPRYRVRLALVKNPYTPLPWAIRLATTLRAGDLREVASDSNLASLLRQQAAGLLQHR